MFSIATVHDEFRAARRCVNVDPTLGCATIYCVGPAEMWTVVLGLEAEPQPQATVTIARVDGPSRDTDERGLLRAAYTWPCRCTVEQVHTMLTLLEAGTITGIAPPLTSERSSAITRSATRRFLCGVHKAIVPP
jgi:hypothetical protein